MADATDNEILLTDEWKLVPVDALNWELCHRHVTTRGKDAGVTKWHHCGRYYSASTIGHALSFVADRLMAERAHGRAMELQDALAEYQRIADRLLAAVARR